MSLEVFFGNNLIDEEYYTGLTNSYELFNDSFRLGTTPSNIYKLSIAKEGVTNQPSNVILKENNTTFAELEIDNIEEQDYTYSYDLTDKMLNLEFYYDASEIFVNGKTTLLAIAQDICSKAGLTLGTTNFRGYNKEISWYDNRRTAREYIGFIAELNGGFARVENSTLYFRKQKTSSVKTIDIDDCENFIIGEYHKITRVVYELGALKYEFGNETGNTLYLNSDNVFITEESEVQAIYNDIKDFEFYSFETGNCPIDYSVKAGDIITFTDGTNNYPTIAQYELEYFGTWIGGYSLSVNTERQEETKVVGNTEKIKNLQVIVDRDANTITQLVETTEEIEHQFETLQDIDGFAEGKYIYLDDASDELIISAKFNGETSQATRSGKNLLNKNATALGSNVTKTVLDTGVRVTTKVAGNNRYCGIEIGKDELLGKIVTINATITLSGTNNAKAKLYFGTSSSPAISSFGTELNTTGSRTVTIPNSFYTNTDRIYLLLYSNVNGDTSINNYVDYTNLQVEIGSEATSYEPYGVMPSPDYPSEIKNLEGNLEVKVVNKNIYDGEERTVTSTYNNILCSGNTSMWSNYVEITQLQSMLPLTFSTYITSSNYTSCRIAITFYNESSSAISTLIGTNATSSNKRTYVTLTENNIPSNATKIKLFVRIQDSGHTENTQIETGTATSDWEKHQEQIVYFPLAEGQKLYEGSYLADDGIHNVRGQIVYDGSSDENWVKNSYPPSGAVQMAIAKPSNIFAETGATAVAKLNCSHFKSENQVVNGMALGGMFNVYPSTDLSITTVAEFKTWLSNNPMTLEYPLVEEEIIPYNTEQQAAWNSIKSLHTYKTVTHIYSDAYAEIGYIKDNMLSAYETKASARLTQQDVQQLKIENGRISSEVSSTQSQLNNYYTKNEADNNTNSTKAELENIIQQNKTEIEQTTQEIALRITDIETNGVDKIETSMGYTFNNDGLNIDKEGAATASTIDNEAFKVKNKSANENVFFAGYVSDQDSAYRGQTIVESTNLVVKNYLNIEGASRFQPYVNQTLGGHGTGAFDIG